MKTCFPQSKELGRRKQLIWGLLVTIAILVLVLPLAIMFGRKKQAPTFHSSVLVPLYVYPAPGAWDPLFAAISKHPALTFTVVINPGNGPGPGALPDANYTKEIPRLHEMGNVKTVGYVSTDYTKRDLGAVVSDINVYGEWAEHGLGMHGIFLDETPSLWDGQSARFLESAAARIRSTAGLGDSPIIIHNPGTTPDARYFNSCTQSVVFEGSYSTYQIHDSGQVITSFCESAGCQREELAVIIHGVPSALSKKDQGKLVNNVKAVAGGVFVTGLDTDYYSSFWAGWGDFVDRVNGVTAAPYPSQVAKPS